jgi:hypothetical protein
MADTPRFSPDPEMLPIVRGALERRVPELAPDPDTAKTVLATVHGLTLAGESVKAIAEITKLTPAQVQFAQRVLEARGDLKDRAQHVVARFAHEGIIAAVEGAMEKIQSGDGKFIERTLEEGGVWSKRGKGDSEGARGAVNPGLPALQINIALPPGVDPAEKHVFGTVHATPKTIDGEKTAT